MLLKNDLMGGQNFTSMVDCNERECELKPVTKPCQYIFFANMIIVFFFLICSFFSHISVACYVHLTLQEGVSKPGRSVGLDNR